jgi:hypothetical protein
MIVLKLLREKETQWPNATVGGYKEPQSRQYEQQSDWGRSWFSYFRLELLDTEYRITIG